MTLSRLSVWIIAARPKTLPAAIAPVVIGSVMAYHDRGFHLLSALAALAGALLIQIGTNFANDYLDFRKGTDTGSRLGPVRVTQARLASPSAVRNATIVVFGLAIMVGLYLVYRGGWPILAVGLVSILLGFAYTAGPVPLAYVGVADFFVLLFFGPVAVGGTYFVQTGQLTAPVIVAGLAPGLFSTAILTVNNLRDVRGDREAGKKTMAVRFGERFARSEYLIAIVAGATVPIWLYAFLSGSQVSLLAVVTLVLAIPTVRTVFNSKGKDLNAALSSTGRLLLIYTVLFSVGWLL